MKICWRHDDACECGEPGCYATADVLLPHPSARDPWCFEACHIATGLATRLRGGIRSPQDPRTNGALR